jgi:4-hydroxy-3-methylbut-2-enyl diphosphate reductase
MAHHIEDASELDPTWVRGRTNVGVTAGASTPGWLMDQVIERIQQIGGPA